MLRAGSQGRGKADVPRVTDDGRVAGERFQHPEVRKHLAHPAFVGRKHAGGSREVRGGGRLDNSATS
jgi:hypothetical protein